MSPLARKPKGLIVFLSTMAVMAGLAFVLSIKNSFDNVAQDDARERDRIASDVRACERGNVLRNNVKAIGLATSQLILGIVDNVYYVVDNEEVVAYLDNKLDPLFAEFQAAVDKIELTDCTEAVPGA